MSDTSSRSTWETLDEQFAPRPRSDLATVDVDGDLVLYEGTNGRAHVLNGSARTVWSIFDGVATVAELADDIAEVYAVDRSEVGDQLVTLVRDLARTGLLEGIDEPDEIVEDCP